ncbi:MAG: hypothetical protein E2590_06625 [Chryseobacterium sp.]|nr:hypothetical protein [Chryseobacterium sp.]
MKNEASSNIKLFGKITAKSLFAWIKVAFIGAVIMITNITIAIILFSDNPGGGFPASGHAGILGAVMGFIFLFMVEFWSALLLTVGILVPVLFIILANKNAIASAIYNVWKFKIADFVEPKIEFYVDKILQKQPDFLKNITNWSVVKVKLLDTINNDSQTPKLQKRIIKFILKKIKMDDVDFKNPNTNLSSILSFKIRQFIEGFAEPDLKLVWILVAIDIVLIILAFVFNDH